MQRNRIKCKLLNTCKADDKNSAYAVLEKAEMARLKECKCRLEARQRMLDAALALDGKSCTATEGPDGVDVDGDDAVRSTSKVPIAVRSTQGAGKDDSQLQNRTNSSRGESKDRGSEKSNGAFSAQISAATKERRSAVSGLTQLQVMNLNEEEAREWVQSMAEKPGTAGRVLDELPQLLEWMRRAAVTGEDLCGASAADLRDELPNVSLAVRKWLKNTLFTVNLT